MPRPRNWKRTLLTLLLLLIGGAIVNVAVAWSVAIRARTGFYLSAPVSAMQRSPSDIAKFAGSCGLVQGTANREFKGFIVRVAGRTMCEGIIMPASIDETRNGVVFQIWEDGWPLPSMRAISVSGSDTKDVNGIRGTWCPPWVDESVFKHRGGYGFSCQPIWTGLAANTLFYSAIILALFASTRVPGQVRRFARIRRNHCPACGYKIAPGVGPMCSECGHPLKPGSPA